MAEIINFKKGQIIEGRITNITDFGIFVQLSDEITGLLHKLNLNNEQDVYSYKKGQTISVIVQKIKDGKISLGLPIIYEELLFSFDTNELLNYLGFSTSTFIGKAERGKHFIYFKNLMTINQTKFLNPITNQNIDARCGADSICKCSLEDVEKVCARDRVCREQVALLDSILDDHWYEIEIYTGRPEFRIKNNDPFRFSVHRINKEFITSSIVETNIIQETKESEENYDIKTMNKIVRQEPDSVRKAKSKVFHKMYVANVRNRLRQLNEPTENDCKRWIWELIQNAKDSISQSSNQFAVDIKVEVNDDQVVFKHNGSPFTADAQQALLYKYSEGKENSESTGRFGTGFLTTHTLSKIVSIDAPLYDDDSCQTVSGFSTTMYRDGLGESDLLDGLTKMEKSTKYYDNPDDWTTYTYHLKTPQNRNALELGLKNFISNIAQVMLFCKELNSVELNNNDTITQIIRTQPQLLPNNTFISEFEIKNNGTTDHTRRFVHKYLEKHSSDLTTRFKTERKLRLMAAIEIDNENNLVDNDNAPSHFCILPLVGSEKHIMPIYLNSPDFEPDSERESLILIGDDMLADKNVISEGGINRLILKESIELYDSLVSYLSENGYHKLFLLAKGLKRTPDFEKNFNKDWFEKEMILPYREVLKKHAIVETDNGNQKLFKEDNTPNIIIPKDTREERQKQIYSLATELFPTNLPLEKYANNWADLIWKECGLFTIKDLCEYVANKQNASNLPSYEWLNIFLQFIKETDETLLKKYALVPNSNGDFISLQESDFAEGVGLTEFMLNTLLTLGVDLKPNLLNTNITAISLPIKVDAKSIAEKIDEQADCIIKDKKLSIEKIVEKLLPLINISLTNKSKYDSNFVEQQQQINSYVKVVFENLQVERIDNNDIPEKAWQSMHKWLISQLINSVSEFKSIDSLPDTIANKTEWINQFIAFVSKEIKEGKLDEVTIIPNQNGNFRFKKDLSLDDNIPEILKTEQAENFGLLLKDSLLHKEVNSVNISNKKDINTVIGIINDIFKNNTFENIIDYLDFAIYLLHFLPEETSQILYNSQKSLFDIVRKYYYERSKSISENTIICNSEDFWRKANDKIISSLQKHIAENATLERLQQFLSESGKECDNGDTIIFLNNFYDYLTSMKIPIDSNIVPNQNGKFCSIDDLYKDDNIPEELKGVLCLCDSGNDFKDILAEKSLSIQPKQNKDVSDIAKLIDDVIKDTFADSRNWDDEKFKQGVTILTEYFRKHKNPNDIFKYSWSKKDSIELNVLWSEKDREMLKELKENGFEKVQLLLAKDAEIQKLKDEKEELLSENAKLKQKKENLEREIQRLKEQKEKAVTEEEKANIEEQIKIKTEEQLKQSNEIAIIEIAVNNGISKEQQKDWNYEAKQVVKKDLEQRLNNEKKRQESLGKTINYTLDGFDDGYSNSPVMTINDVSYPIVVKSYKKQDEPFHINPIEWELLLTKNAMLFIRDNNGVSYADILGLLKDQSHLGVSFSTENLNIEDRLVKFAHLLHFFKDAQFNFGNLHSTHFDTAQNLSNYCFDTRKTEDDIADGNSDIML